MASFTKVNDFVVNLANAMDLDADTLVVALSNTDPTAGTPDRDWETPMLF